ncbi:glutaredoxin 3 [Sphingomonas sp. ASV193]|uniref:glutaredoxin 3 n=1 Tax=Sphingomonas sp. ASV193 TaxID=3144405 RepID=UPI0032E868EB
MPRIEIYTKTTCPFCIRAKRLLDMKRVSYDEILIDRDLARRDEMVGRAGGRSTVPQIFIAGKHVGGCDDLMAMEALGTLDPLLRAA